ncbi:prefoldin domain-containing protein [Haloarcula quadrata]|nr:hypothetical protein [Haloarcula quadrata]
MHDDIDLPERAVEVLELVDEYGRPTATTLREAIYWASKNQHIHYRLDQLAGRGLVETWKDEDAGGRGALAPRRATTTGEGEEFLDLVDEDGGTPDTVEERLEELEKTMANMKDTYGKAKKRIAELEAEVEEHDEDLDGLAEGVRDIRRFLDD